VGDKHIPAQAAPFEELHRGALGGMADGFYVPDDTAGPAPVTLYTFDPLATLMSTASSMGVIDGSIAPRLLERMQRPVASTSFR
jgi:hypothetical protein